MSGYHLGIDLGTTYTAAAIERDGRVEPVTLGNRQASVPSVLFLREDGGVLVGEAALRRGASEPGRLAREFKRRVGDPTPVLLGGVPHGADTLMGKLLRWTVERVVEVEGGPPASIALTHPANWGPFKLDLLQQAARQANVGVARFLSEPEAAATSYARQQRVEPGSIIAVYDLGGGTFDATVLRTRGDGGFDLLGQPEGIERLGGIDFDAAVFDHVWRSLGPAVAGLDVDDPAVTAAVARLRRECVDAKEALSADTDVSIPVALPTVQTDVRLTRGEFEAMIRPVLAESVTALRRAVAGAGVEPEQVAAVLLVGGSSRIPLVAELVTSSLGRPVAVDANPKDAVCAGAALAAARSGPATTPVAPVAAPAPVVAPPPPAAPASTPAPAPVTPPPAAPVPVAAEAARSRGGLVAALVGLVVLAAVAAALLATRGGGEEDDASSGFERGATTTQATEAPGIEETTTVTVDPFTAVEDQFLSDCIDDQVSSGELDQPSAQLFCECAFAGISNSMDFETFQQLNEEARRTGEQPAEIAEAVAQCVDRF